MPGAGDTAIEDLAFSEWTVLMSAYVGKCRNPASIAEDCNPLAACRNHTGSILTNTFHWTHFYETLAAGEWSLVHLPFPKGSSQVKSDHRHNSHGQQTGQQGTGFRLQHSKDNMCDQEAISHVDAHV